VKDVFCEQELASILALAAEVMASDDANMTPYSYKTCQASRYPCSCQYKFAGIMQDRFQYYASDGKNIPKLESLMKIMETGIRERLGLKNERGTYYDTALPEHMVINSCVGNPTSIAEPHDRGAMFDAINNQAVIFSLNIQRDGVLFFKLQGNEKGKPHTEALKYFLTKTDLKKLTTPTFVPENSLLVMGGWCQAVLLHGSIDHASLISSDVHHYTWREAFTVDDY
jgi:hypothetical protein